MGMMNEDEVIEKLRKLQKEVDEALFIANQNRGDIKGAINWADLKCVSTEYCFDVYGDFSYKAFIEECDPSSVDLISFVHDNLESDWTDLEIICEW